MVMQKFTVILVPIEEGGYQAFFPYYPNCVSDGLTVEEALVNSKLALEGVLQADADNDGDCVPPGVHAPHVVIGEVDVRVPSRLIESAETISTGT